MARKDNKTRAVNRNIFLLKSKLFLGEAEAILLNVGIVNREYRHKRIAEIDRTGKETCIALADAYEQTGNKDKWQEYYQRAKRYAHMGVGLS